MKEKLDFYQILDHYLSTKNWEVLKEKYIAVEIPETKEMYYVSFDLEGDDQKLLRINLANGNIGLDYLMLTLHWQIQPIDLFERSHFMDITFETSFESFCKGFKAEDLEESNFEFFKTYGYPYVFAKSKAGLSRPISALEIKDLRSVFEALSQVSIKKLKKIKKITDNTTFKTLFKKEDQWQSEQQKVVFDDEKAKYSDLEIYPLIKNTDPIDETWYVFSVYTTDLVSAEPLAKENSVGVFNGGAYLINAAGRLLQALDFVGASQELDTVKKIIVKGLKEDRIRPKKMVFHLRSLYVAFKGFLEALGIKALYQPGNEVVDRYIKDYIRDEGFDSQIMDRQLVNNPHLNANAFLRRGLL